MSMEQFRQAFRGPIFGPGDPGYDTARKVYNGMIDKRPAPDRPVRGRGGRDCRRALRRARTIS